MPIWVTLLRPLGTDIMVTAVMSLAEVAECGPYLELRMRYAPDLRLVTLRLPSRTRREQVFEALIQLTPEERRGLYNLPQHPMA